MCSFKSFLGFLSISATFIAYFSYIKSVLQNKTKPHLITWVIWGTGMMTVFFVQFFNNAGAGSWGAGASGMAAVFVAIITFFKSSKNKISKTDLLFLIITILAIPVWYFTSSPLYSVLILTLLNIIGYIPTIIKTYHKPYEENILSYVMFAVRDCLSLASLSQISTTNTIYQAMSILANLTIITIYLLKRNK